MAMKPDAQKLLRRAADLFSSVERSNQDTQWNDLTKFLMNNQAGTFNRGAASKTDLGSLNIITTPGGKKTAEVYDSTGMHAVRDLASAFQGTLTNPATKWFNLRYATEDLNEDTDAVSWLENAVNQTLLDFTESNFDTEIAKAYQSFTALGNMAILFETDDDGLFQFTAIHLAQIVWAENKKGRVDTVFRRFSLTASQAIERWGKKVHKDIVKAYESDPDKEFEFMHAIYPRDPRKVDVKTDGPTAGKKRPVASVYLDVQHGAMIDEDGYYEMPMFIARWSTMPGEVYGRGPGHLAIPDVKTLNKIKKAGLQVASQQAAVSWFVNARDNMGTYDFRPNGISIVKDINGIKPANNPSNTEILRYNVEELKNSVRAIFYLDKLLLPPRNETGEMTAYETAQRVEQMQRVLGPTLSRLYSEALSEIVVRAFKIKLRRGDFGELPDIFREQDLDIEVVYVNQLARAQQVQDVSTIQQWIQGLALIAQAKPEVLDNINVDGIARHTSRVLGVPEIAVLGIDEVEQVRQQRAQAQQQQMQMEAAVAQADIQSKTKE